MSRLPSAYRPEQALITAALEPLRRELDWHSVAARAQPWVQAARANPPAFWAMESLLREYPISRPEGLALMRLAEALLRTPDVDSAVALTADQLGRADFDQGSGHPLGRLSAMALRMARQFLPDGEGSGVLGRLGERSVVAAAVRAIALLGEQFVLAQDIDAALKRATDMRRKQAGLCFSYDMLGEGARSEADAQRYFAAYQQALTQVARQAAGQGSSPRERDGLSIKLSALHPRYEVLQQDRVMSELLPRVWALCDQAARADVNLTLDAEEVDRLEISLDLIEALIERIAREHPHWTGFGLAMQAYQTRSAELIEAVVAMARRHGVQLMCRLVKGAYWDTEIKRAQELGLEHYPVWTYKRHTDIAYLRCAQLLLQANDVIYPQFATHNAATIAAIEQMAKARGAAFELQRLHGMGEGIHAQVARDLAAPCRVYAPVGAHRDLLAYLVRRLLENGANTSFVHQLADPQVSEAELLATPLGDAASPGLPLPPDLYADRANSIGLDIAEASVRDQLMAAWRAWQPMPVPDTPVAALAGLHARALDAFDAWNERPVDERARMLEAAADRLQAELPAFAAELVGEARKTWNDAIAEVREAIDFLRYYALDARRSMVEDELPGPTGERNLLRLQGRGVWVCISPWNFPLAIFTGQVAAALVTGNTVLAKPAEQTPAIARRMIAMLHAAGVPADVLQGVYGPGETIGAGLIALPEVAGVVFTGSTQVARLIQRQLADKPGPIVPLIAETGGLNAMVVDPTALPEQVVDAVIQSAFRSAGQRCSALRLLCLHEAIADRVIELVQGAASELRCGPGQQFDTDVGPVIDLEAAQRLRDGLLRLGGVGKVLPLGSTATDDPLCVPPALVEITSLEQAGEELFGPVLMVLRWSGDPLALIRRINALGYGLTLGIQTRIDGRAEQLARAARIGNVYVNRNMTGAVVGVQPFGGEGLSGTGPKAGGPHYLLRFCAEQCITINTAAAGGNATLMATIAAS